MWLAEKLDPVAPLNNRKDIENFIDQSLMGDWIIRIEYSGRNAQGQSDWLQWDSTFFAITSSDDVMEAIDSCYAYFPDREIRIHAEKVRPQTRMVYSVYQPVESGLNVKAPVAVAVASEAANQEWHQPVDESVSARGNKAWRFLAAAGTLAGTLIVWEAASN
ncbi:ribulose bisphosphate carboxylase small subunit [Kaarinaea lacus]